MPFGLRAGVSEDRIFRQWLGGARDELVAAGCAVRWVRAGSVARRWRAWWSWTRTVLGVMLSRRAMTAVGALRAQSHVVSRIRSGNRLRASSSVLLPKLSMTP